MNLLATDLLIMETAKGLAILAISCLELSLMCFAIRLVVPFQLDLTVASTSEVRGKVRRLL